MSKQTKKTQLLAVNGVLAALICVVSFLPLRTLGLEITFSMVPIAIGACIYGPTTGAVLGGVFGTVSFIQCITGYSAFGAMLLSISPIYTLLVCIPTRVLAGWITGLVAKAMLRPQKSNLPALSVGSLLAPVLNTLFFMSTICLFFYNTDYIQGFANTLGSTNPFMFVILFVGINGLVEILAGALIALPLSKALSKAFKY